MVWIQVPSQEADVVRQLRDGEEPADQNHRLDDIGLDVT